MSLRRSLLASLMLVLALAACIPERSGIGGGAGTDPGEGDPFSRPGDPPGGDDDDTASPDDDDDDSAAQPSDPGDVVPDDDDATPDPDGESTDPDAVIDDDDSVYEEPCDDDDSAVSRVERGDVFAPQR